MKTSTILAKISVVAAGATIFGLGTMGSAQAASLTTTFAGGSGFNSPASSGNMFDLTTLSNALNITSLDVSTLNTGALTVNVYTKTGTYVGSETNSGVWSKVATGSTTATTSDNGSVTTVDISDFLLNPNTTYGMYVELIGTGVNFTSGANTYSNSDLSITTGSGIGGAFGSTAVLTPRTWNGTINYNVANAQSVPEPASVLGLLMVGGLGLETLKRKQKV
jgi:hypothetical protein